MKILKSIFLFCAIAAGTPLFFACANRQSDASTSTWSSDMPRTWNWNLKNLKITVENAHFDGEEITISGTLENLSRDECAYLAFYPKYDFEPNATPNIEQLFDYAATHVLFVKIGDSWQNIWSKPIYQCCGAPTIYSGIQPNARLTFSTTVPVFSPENLAIESFSGKNFKIKFDHNDEILESNEFQISE